MPKEATLTCLIRSMQRGDESANGTVYSAAAERLRHISMALMARETPTAGLGASDLVQEAWIQKAMRLQGVGPVNDREHFFALMTRGMRQILLDRFRRREAKKRAAPELAAWRPGAESGERIVALRIQRERLRSIDPQADRILTFKLSDGMSWDEIASRTQRPVWKCRAEYDHAIHWLRKQMK